MGQEAATGALLGPCTSWADVRGLRSRAVKRFLRQLRRRPEGLLHPCRDAASLVPTPPCLVAQSCRKGKLKRFFLALGLQSGAMKIFSRLPLVLLLAGAT